MFTCCSHCLVTITHVTLLQGYKHNIWASVALNDLPWPHTVWVYYGRLLVLMLSLTTLVEYFMCVCVFKKTSSDQHTLPGGSVDHMLFLSIEPLLLQWKFEPSHFICHFFVIFVWIEKGSRSSLLFSKSKAQLHILHGSCPKQPQVIEQLDWSCCLLGNLLKGLCRSEPVTSGCKVFYLRTFFVFQGNLTQTFASSNIV